MVKKDFILGVDLDGVCGDYFNSIRPIAAEWLNVDLKSLTHNASYALTEWGIGKGAYEFKKLHKFAVTKRNLFENMLPIVGASKVLRELSELGVRIRIITHRLCIKNNHATAVIQTVNWLEKHDFPYWDLCFMKDKGSVDADLYIEDSSSNVQALTEQGKKVIIFDASYNKDCSGPRATTWDHVFEMVKDHLIIFNKNSKEESNYVRRK